MIIAFAVIVLLFVGLTVRIGWIQIINTDMYANKAVETQTKDEIIPPKRGAILDRNLKTFAVSTASYRVFVRLKPYNDSDPVDPKYREEQRAAAADILSASLGIDRAEIVEKMNSDSNRVSIAKDVNKEQMESIRTGIEKKGVMIIEAEDASKRQYPLGAFAAHILGSVNRDGKGQSGIELEYDQYLTGTVGRRIMSTDIKGNPLSEGQQESHAQENGRNVVLTIDETIQYYAEESIAKAYERTQADRVECIIMDPKNGDILGMAAYPEFDPNDPGTPLGEAAQAEFAQLGDEQKTEYLNAIWRNPVVSDLYEPGSVFKLVTVSSALETGAVTPDSHVTCKGFYQVEDREIKCWNYPRSHGDQTVAEAIGNSCNPAMMQVIQKMGYDKFYQYLELFGMTDRTGVDFPGEASPLIQDKKISGPVGLATMSFGMGLNITAIEMANAVCAIGNNGNLMKPRLVKALSDEAGNIVHEFPTKILRQVISQQTADEVKNIMEYVTREAGGQVANVPGYRIGSKTGTAQKLVNGEYSTRDVVGSTIAIAPIDDPRFVVLVVVDNPRVGEYGSTTAGPAVREITEEILRYMNIKPEYTDEEKANRQRSEIVLPELTGKPASEAESILLSLELNYSVQGERVEEDFTVADQYPKPGGSVDKGGTVYLYSE
ncbi:MAG: PASTA domain-containing protein [Clostridiales Family XIII bacterium]|jgi:stage V sporulation protein D (sporulation-specific penicillin-binding protein)|nr:PASTA domain-containing protein [Clostridiales Family XIII bacterium]